MCLALLIADDQPSVSELISRYLAEHEDSRDSVVTYCPSMDSVWAFFEGGGRADIVFLDLVQPPLTALEVIAMIPRLVRLCPTVITISGFPQYRDAALAAGATEFLSKLGDMDTPATFFEKVARFFREARGPSPIEKHVDHLQRMIDPPTPQDRG